MQVDLLSDQSGLAVSAAYVVAMDEDNPGLARIINLVGYSSSWNAADVTVEISHDWESSPSNWLTMQVLNSGAMADLTLEANFALNIELPPGVAFRVRNADTGSPLTTVSVSVVGPITSA